MSALRKPLRHVQCGLTLVELVITLTLLGVLAAAGAMLMSGQANRFVEGGDRALLADSADRGARRLADDLRTALPNSLRLITGSTVWVEFLPVSEVGRARLRSTASGTGDILNVDAAGESSFEVLGPAPVLHADSQLVLHNLGQDRDDAWLGDNRRGGLSWNAGTSTLSFTAAGRFPSEPPRGRFALVRGPVSFRCEGGTDSAGNGTGTLTRYDDYVLTSTQPVDLVSRAAAGQAREVVLATEVSACSAGYTVSMRNLGLFTLQLSLMRGGATAQSTLQVMVDNTP